MFEHLGFIVDEKNRPLSHRSILKILVNPILRCFGLCIATEIDSNNGRPGRLVFIRHRPVFKLWERYELSKGARVIPIRRFF